MKWLMGVFLAYGLLGSMAVSQELLTFLELPVQWQKAERWQWQGQDLLSQRFSSKQDVATVAFQIQKLAPDVDLRVQRLASAWLLSFDHAPTHTHYLFLLSAQSQGTEGWFSTMKLLKNQKSPAALVPSTLFTGLYQHSWSLSDPDAHNMDEPFYVLLQPINSSKRLWLQLNNRFIQQAWQGGSCLKGQWCQWYKNTQKLWLWVDPKQGLWHVLWWPK